MNMKRKVLGRSKRRGSKSVEGRKLVEARKPIHARSCRAGDTLALNIPGAQGIFQVTSVLGDGAIKVKAVGKDGKEATLPPGQGVVLLHRHHRPGSGRRRQPQSRGSNNSRRAGAGFGGLRDPAQEVDPAVAESTPYQKGKSGWVAAADVHWTGEVQERGADQYVGQQGGGQGRLERGEEEFAEEGARAWA